MSNAPAFVDEDLVRALAINVKSLPAGVPPRIMTLVKSQTNAFVDSLMTPVFSDWQMLKLAPELIPEQIIVAASLIAAGKVEAIMYAANAAGGQPNQYGIDLDQDGRAILDEIVNARMSILGMFKAPPMSADQPEVEARWVGGLTTQGWISLKFSNLVSVRLPTYIESEALTNAGYTDRIALPISRWYDMLGLEASYAQYPTWGDYVTELLADVARLGIARVKGPAPTSIGSAIYNLAITLGGSGIRYLPQLSLSTSMDVLDACVAGGALMDEVEGPLLTDVSQDTMHEYRDIVTQVKFAGYKVSTPQYVSSYPDYEPLSSIVSWIAYLSTYQPLTPESSGANLSYYAGRKNFSTARGIPMLSEVGVEGSGAQQAAYLLWAITKTIQDQLASNLEVGPVVISEHVDENSTQFGLRTYSGSSWSDKSSMDMFENLKAIIGTASGAQSSIRFKMAGLDNPVVTCWKRDNGDTVAIICSGLAFADDPVPVSVRFLSAVRVKFFLPTDSATETDLGAGQAFTMTVSYKPIVLVIQAT